MRLYLLSCDEYDSRRQVGIFSTLEAAQAVIQQPWREPRGVEKVWGRGPLRFQWEERGPDHWHFDGDPYADIEAFELDVPDLEKLRRADDHPTIAGQPRGGGVLHR